MAPLVVMRPIELPPKLLEPSFVNHSAPSGPAAIRNGPAMLIFGSVKFEITPLVVTRPIEPRPAESMNHRAPSEPAARPWGPVTVGSVKFVTTPLVVMRPIELCTVVFPKFVNHSAPSDPVAIHTGETIVGS